MWIKTAAGDLLNCDLIAKIFYRKNKNQTIAVWDDGSTILLCQGDATGVISQAIQRDQKYLEVSDCG